MGTQLDLFDSQIKLLVSKVLWSKYYHALKRKDKKRFREAFKAQGNIESDSHFRNMKNGHRRTPEELEKFANDYFQISR